MFTTRFQELRAKRDYAGALRSIGAPEWVCRMAAMTPEQVEVEQRAMRARGEKFVDATNFPSSKRAGLSDAAVRARAKELGRQIAQDEHVLINQRQYEMIDDLNRADAARIGQQIASDAAASKQQQEKDNELRRRMRSAS